MTTTPTSHQAETGKKAELMDDLFGGDTDDFNPRAGDPAAASGGEFSQFAAAPPPPAG